MENIKTIQIPLYFDTEFTGLQNGTQLISIGCVFQGNTFYAESSEFVLEEAKCDEETRKWLEHNVVSNLLYYYNPMIKQDEHFMTWDSLSAQCYGTFDYIGTCLVSWVKTIIDQTMSYENVKFDIIPVSDVMYYDMVLLNDLVKIGVKHEFNPVCYLKNNYGVRFVPAGLDIMSLIPIAAGSDITVYEVFDLSREELIVKLGKADDLEAIKDEMPCIKHNALYDARVIEILYLSLWDYIIGDNQQLMDRFSSALKPE